MHASDDAALWAGAGAREQRVTSGDDERARAMLASAVAAIAPAVRTSGGAAAPSLVVFTQWGGAASAAPAAVRATHPLLHGCTTFGQLRRRGWELARGGLLS